VSIDYNGVGGIGIKVTDEILEFFKKNGIFTDEDWDQDGHNECLSKLDILYSVAGSSYSGKFRYYLFVEGKNLEEINKNSKQFIDKLAEYDLIIELKDLIVIEDLYIY